MNGLLLEFAERAGLFVFSGTPALADDFVLNLTEDYAGGREMIPLGLGHVGQLLVRGGLGGKAKLIHGEEILPGKVGDGEQFRLFDDVVSQRFPDTVVKPCARLTAGKRAPLAANLNSDGLQSVYPDFLAVRRQQEPLASVQHLQRVFEERRLPCLRRTLTGNPFAVRRQVAERLQFSRDNIAPLLLSWEIRERFGIAPACAGNQFLDLLPLLLCFIEANETGNAAHLFLHPAEHAFNRFASRRVGVIDAELETAIFQFADGIFPTDCGTVMLQAVDEFGFPRASLKQKPFTGQPGAIVGLEHQLADVLTVVVPGNEDEFERVVRFAIRHHEALAAQHVP